MYLCLCHGVTERHIEEAVDQGMRRLKELRTSLQVGSRCGRCNACVHQCLKNTLSVRQTPSFTTITG